MRTLLLACAVAWRDYWRERLISVCSILSLAAILAPLFVLFGVKYGIISTMTEMLLQDPKNFQVIPVGSGKYAPEWFAELSTNPSVAFVMPQTRSIAATMDLSRDAGGDSFVTVSLTASSPRDPELTHWGVDFSHWGITSGNAPLGIVLSEPAARKLGVVAGDRADASVGRSKDGVRERISFPVMVGHVLPLYAQQKEMAYVPLEVLVATEEFRDGKFTPRQLESGHYDMAWSDLLNGDREFASFRLFARSLDDVAILRDFFSAKHVEVYTRAEEIRLVSSLDHSFTVIFILITGAAVFGFTASTASNSLAGVKRKARSLGVLGLLGFPQQALLIFPVIQALFTGVVGTVLALAMYTCVAYSIDSLFSENLHSGKAICTLLWQHAAAGFFFVFVLSGISAFFGAWQAARIEPSEVIRDV